MCIRARFRLAAILAEVIVELNSFHRHPDHRRHDEQQTHRKQQPELTSFLKHDCHRFLSALLGTSLIAVEGEHIAFAANGHQDPGLLGIIAKFLAQAGDMHVDCSRADPFRVKPPDAGQQFVS